VTEASDVPGVSGEVVDSPTGWVNRHIRSYVDSDGAKGHTFHGAPALLLTTRGRRSGQPRRTALYYGRDGDAFVVVASNGGSARDPLWYGNLLADPAVHVQVGAEHHDGTARTATGAERERLWALMTEIWPAYAGYGRKTRREIPVVVIDV
jgi:deazaflavin-dependent oxidoreductase (nitroreductase family)